MKNKYLEMHQDFMEVCKNHNLRPIAGKVAYLDCETKTCARAEKTFYLFTEEFSALEAVIENSFSDVYSIKGFHEEGSNRYLKLERTDIFASNFDSVVKYPKGSLHPAFVIREITQADDVFLISLNKSNKHIPKTLLENLSCMDYMDGNLYIPEEADAFYELVYDFSNTKRAKIKEYEYFDEYIDAQQFISEAKANGLVSKKQKKRLKEYRKWLKDVANPAFTAYKEYKKALRALRLSNTK